MSIKSTQYTKLAANAYYYLKSCKSHERNETKHQTLSFQFFVNKSSILMLFVLYFFMWLANFNMWTAKHLVQASCTELTLTYLKSANKFWKIAQAMFLSWTDFSCYSISCTCQAGETFSGTYILGSRYSAIQIKLYPILLRGGV